MQRTLLMVLLGLGLLFIVLGRAIEGFINRVEPVALPKISEAARALHDSAWVVDLHADSLLFRRNLRKRSRHGHVDLPRLREGGVALQVFGVVPRVYMGANIDLNDESGLDAVALLGCLTLRSSCWRSDFGRLEEQAAILASNVEKDDALYWIRTRDDLARLHSLRSEAPTAIGALLGVEGAHALERDPENLERAFELGVRMLGLAHFFDNAYASSAHGVSKGGLSELGRATLLRMEELGIAVDLAHLAPRAIDEALALVKKPVFVSHGGAKGTCDNARTLSDDQIRAIAAGGGVIGVGYWKVAVCGTTPAHVARAMRYIADLVGDDHVALGSDYDGGTTVGFDTSALPALTQAMLDVGLSEDSVRKILGTNARRVLRVTLPGN